MTAPTISAQGRVTVLAATLERHVHHYGASRRTLHTLASLWPTYPHLFTDDVYNWNAWLNDWEAIQEIDGLHPDVYTLTQRVTAKNLREVSEFIGQMNHWGGVQTVLAIFDAVNPAWQDGYEHVAALILLEPAEDEARDWAANGSAPSLDTALTLLALADNGPTPTYA